MNKDIIGIKLADGSFYPVLTAGETAEKHLKLTTARDGQTSIRLHLYRSASGVMEDAEYIDSLRIDGLAFHEMNEPTVTLSLSQDDEGTLSAELTDSETGTSSSKTVSLMSIDSMPDIPDFDMDFDIPEPQDSSAFDVPPLTEEDLDFDLDDQPSSFEKSDSDIPSPDTAVPGTASNEDFSMKDSPFTDSSLYDTLDSEKKKKSGISIPLAICIICAVICLCVLGIMLFINPPKWLSKSPESVPEYNFDGQLIPDSVDEEEPSPNENCIVVADEPLIPVQPEIVEPDEEESSKQIKHLVKWGDTLWDIAGCYYKNPWAYPRIAKANNIKNPDFIVSGTILTIPR